MDGAIQSFTARFDADSASSLGCISQSTCVEPPWRRITSTRRLPALQCDGQVRHTTIVMQHLEL